MKLAQVYIEHPSLELDQCYSYRYEEEPLQAGMRVRVPFAAQSLIGIVASLSEISEAQAAAFPYRLKRVLGMVDTQPLLNEELLRLGRYMAQLYVAPTISCYQSMLPRALKPKTMQASIRKEEIAVYVKEAEGLTAKQQQALRAFQSRSPLAASVYRKEYKSIARRLIEKGCVRIEKREKQAVRNDRCKQDSSYVLSDCQQQAFTSLKRQKGHEVVLLHGVTGSGKTEVFLRYAQEMVKQNRQVLFLVPEIALTPQMVKRVEERFGNEVAIYHSQLSDQEKYEQYQLVRQGKVAVVVGTRSAVFMPFERLGAIILDEEHDTSYKQDATPRYHCRDVAIWRGRYHNCKVILSSATPSLESYSRAYKGVYRLIEMKERINGQCLPKVRLIDQKQALRQGDHHILSTPLREAIKERLNRQEQVILLLNRRGYTPVLRCLTCGEVIRCPHCDLSLSYHKEEQRLKCHVCGYTRPLPKQCPNCGGEEWRYLGMGTQLLQEQVQACFPKARIVRMDADTTRRKGAHARLLEQFAQDADILLGTQMIAKGLDYENVTLVGILNADAMLNRGDYRSSELTYDLLEQACGRSGRGDKAGEVILQAYDTAHYAIQCAMSHHYRAFFQQEMKYRHLAGYPPYTYLSAVIYAHKTEAAAREGAALGAEMLREQRVCKVLGPIALNRIKDEYRYRIILKGSDRKEQAHLLRTLFAAHRQRKQRARMEIDVDLLMLE